MRTQAVCATRFLTVFMVFLAALVARLAPAQTSSIWVSKVATNGGTTSFTFDGDLGEFSLRAGMTLQQTGLPAGDYDISEHVPPRWQLTDVTCVGGSSTPTATGVTVHLGSAEDVRCTFTNVGPPASITVVKQAEGAPYLNFGLEGDFGYFTLQNGDGRSWLDLPMGDYDILEPLTSGSWRLAEVTCDGGASTTIADGVTVHLMPGDDVSCLFRNVQNGDLSVTKGLGSALAYSGGPVVWTITVANDSNADVSGAVVSDTLPAPLVSAVWTCAGSNGGLCGGISGSGDILETVDLPGGGSRVTFTVTAWIDPDYVGPMENTASVDPPAGLVDPYLGNNTDSDGGFQVTEAPPVPALSLAGTALLALLLAAVGLARVRGYERVRHGVRF